MAYLSFADLMAGSIRVSPAEAAALTLAVARKLDQENAAGRELHLPDDHGILLNSTGAIAFVRGIDAPAPDNRTALSALLMRLLRLNEDGPRARVPGGLLIVLARNLGHIQLPPTSPAAFRDALERFASSDPALLAAIFWRAARARGGSRRNLTGGGNERVERRRGDPTRVELRRELRKLERELFVMRHRPAGAGAKVADRSRHAELSTRSALRWSGIAAAVVLLASMAAGSGTRAVRPAAVAPVPVADGVRPVSAVSANPRGEPFQARAAATGDDVVPSPAHRPKARSGSPGRVPAKAVGELSRSSRGSRRAVTRDRAATRFAGGARQIAWTIQN